MLDNYKLIILGGGFHRCTPQWNKNRIESERYYKIYIPTQGSVKIETLEGEFSIVPSQLYFISGHRLKSQRCPRYMDVHWIHFTTESIYLNYLLDQTPSVQSWPLSETKWCLEDCENLSRSFPRFEGKHSPPYPNTPLSSHCRMQGLLLLVISRLLDKIEKKNDRSVSTSVLSI